MFTKKAQISIEVLTILSILVVGGVIFGVYYLNGVNKEMSGASKLKLTPEETDSPSMQPGNEIPTDPITPSYPGSFEIDISLNPDEASLPNTNFDIVVTLNGVSHMDGDINVTQIDVTNKDTGALSLDCNYGTAQIPGTLAGLNISIGNVEGASANLTFSCSTDGNYIFTMYANGIDDDGNYKSSPPASVDKEITSTLPLEASMNLSLVPEGRTPQGMNVNKRFGIDVNVIDYSFGTPYIKQIYVYDENNLNPVNNCDYNGTQIPSEGYTFSFPLLMTNISPLGYTVYNSLLDQFSCDTLGAYYITVVAGESGNTDHDVNTYIIKEIDYLKLNLELINPTGQSEAGSNFDIKLFVNGYNLNNSHPPSDINITNVYVTDSITGNPVAVCWYGVTKIVSTGLTLNNVQLNRSGNDYNLIMEGFKCNAEGHYLFKFTAHDSLETTTYDYNAIIEKLIGSNTSCRCCDVLSLGTVKDASDLDCIRYDLNGNYTLQNNINLSHALLSSEPWYDSINGWNPIGTVDSAFTGSLDGNNHVISNLYSKRSAPYPNFFNSLFVKATDAVFKDFNLSNVDLNVTGGTGTALVFYAGDSNFTNIHATGNVKGSGGLVGIGGAYYDNCSFEGNVEGASGTGGLIGRASDWGYSGSTGAVSKLFNCYTNINLNVASVSGGLTGEGGLIDSSYSTGIIKGRGGCNGGLVGIGGIITNSYSTATVMGTSSYGGLLGCGGHIINSYSTGDINTNTEAAIAFPYYFNKDIFTVGGLAGMANNIRNSYSNNTITITPQPGKKAIYIGGLAGILAWDSNDNYSRSNITVTSGNLIQIGGLVGQTGTRNGAETGIRNSYSTGYIHKSPSATESNVKGLVGKKNTYNGNTGIVSNSYWDMNTSERSIDPPAGYGFKRTTDDMTLPNYNTNTYVDWNFSGLWIEDTDYSQNDGYPYLNQEPGDRYCYLTGGLSTKEGVFACIVNDLESMPQMSPSQIAKQTIEEGGLVSQIPDRSYYYMRYNN